MAEYFIPDNRFEAPSFYYPNRKPVGNVQIDWDHPLAAGLVYAAIDGRGTNLVDGDTGYDATFTTVVDGVHGQGRDFSSATTSHKFDISLGGVHEYSCFSIIKTLGNITPTDSVLRQDGACTPLQVWSGNIQASAVWIPSLDSLPSISVAQNVPVTCFSTRRRSGQTHRIYQNGIFRTSEGTGLNNISVVTTPFVHGGTEANTELFNGIIFTAFYWKGRSLTDGEIASLHANPYQFLIPK